MAQRNRQRVLVIAVLLGCLTLALPPRAEAAPPGGPEGLRQWAAHFLENSLLTLWRLAGNTAPPETPRVKGGFCTNPDGCAGQPPAGPACSTCGDQGSGQDPNG